MNWKFWKPAAKSVADVFETKPLDGAAWASRAQAALRKRAENQRAEAGQLLLELTPRIAEAANSGSMRLSLTAAEYSKFSTVGGAELLAERGFRSEWSLHVHIPSTYFLCWGKK